MGSLEGKEEEMIIVEILVMIQDVKVGLIEIDEVKIMVIMEEEKDLIEEVLIHTTEEMVKIGMEGEEVSMIITVSFVMEGTLADLNGMDLVVWNYIN